MSDNSCRCLTILQQMRGSRKLILFIVAVALLLDNMLFTVVVPIIPEFLYDIEHPQDKPINLTTTPKTIGPEPCLSSNHSVTNNCTSAVPHTLCVQKQADLLSENFEVGILFASKPFMQIVASPFVGIITNKIGYSIPMLCGFFIMFTSTLMFGFGLDYGTLFAARALQGIGTSFAVIAGIGMLANQYPDDKERGSAISLAFSGIALGLLIGAPFGSAVYQFFGKTAPFLILAGLALAEGLLQLVVFPPRITKQEQDGASILSLIRDPYILITSGVLIFSNLGLGALEATLPIWMMSTMDDVPTWQLGAVFLPLWISYIFGVNVFGAVGHKIGRWLATMVGFGITGGCLICVPFTRNIYHLIAPLAGVGLAIGMIDSSTLPQLGLLVDLRHTAVYGSVYALADITFGLGFTLGAALSGTLVQTIGFRWVMIGAAIISFLYAPLMIFVKNPQSKSPPESKSST